MREKLAVREDERLHFEATFERFGIKKSFGYQKQTLLFKNVTLDGEEVTDHIWFTMGKQFEKLNLRKGDKVEFKARIKEYIKGGRYHEDQDGYDWQEDYQLDYKLSHPTQIKKV